MCECSTIIVMVVIHWVLCSVITQHPLCNNCQGHVGWLIKNRGRHAPAFPGGAVDNEARPALHPAEETANEPPPGSAAPRASHQSDRGPLAPACVSTADVLVRPSQNSDENDRTARVDVSNYSKEITNPSVGMPAWSTPPHDQKKPPRSGASGSAAFAALDPPHCARG